MEPAVINVTRADFQAGLYWNMYGLCMVSKKGIKSKKFNLAVPVIPSSWAIAQSPRMHKVWTHKLVDKAQNQETRRSRDSYLYMAILKKMTILNSRGVCDFLWFLRILMIFDNFWWFLTFSWWFWRRRRTTTTTIPILRHALAIC